MPKVFICFIGTDGSGKSTLTSNVFQKIREKDKRIKKIYGRYTPLLIKYVMAAGRRFLLDKNKNIPLDHDVRLDKKKSLFRKSRILSQLYISLIMIEYYFELIFKLIIPYKMGYSIISDRYVFDTIVNDIAIDMELSTIDVTNLLSKFWLVIPRPDITFLVQVPEHVAIKRKNDIPSLSYLKIRNRFYNEISASEQFVVLDGTLSISELEERVFTEMSKDR